MKKLIAVFLGTGFLATPAVSQSLTYVQTTEALNSVLAGGALDGQPVNTEKAFVQTTAPNPAGGDYLEYFRLSDILNPIGSQVANLGQQIRTASRKAEEGITLAASFNIMNPDPGDRFAFSLGGAGYSGKQAGSVAVSARLKSKAVAYAGYARSSTGGIFKGGVGISFK